MCIISVYIEEPTGVPRIKFQDAIGDSLQKESIMGNSKCGKRRAAEEIFKPENAFNIQMVGRFI